MTQYVVEIDGRSQRLVQLRESGRARWVAELDSGRVVELELVGRSPEGGVCVRLEGVEHTLEFDAVPGERSRGVASRIVRVPGERSREVRVSSAADVVLAADVLAPPGTGEGESGEATLFCPMTGVVLEVSVRPGQQVRRGDPLVVVEAMKMENTLYAPHEAVVEEICVNAGETVRRGQELIRWSAGNLGNAMPMKEQV
ncbi:hypothetical protein DL240_07035 [Lujinxingia litoralis]|uniref:Lipoyl-binding domain-containing protein n=1 Tax=Lujinxingia litoralis TaxID=2211119 RepID=A0A328C985_9DELT|nr:biotin/lipoyl-containing protein [Lujinxingia litoralis]RAL23896.1 hypothetical protein DL240_07035 [Lujinxingia litoralis]